MQWNKLESKKKTLKLYIVHENKHGKQALNEIL